MKKLIVSFLCLASVSAFAVTNAFTLPAVSTNVVSSAGIQIYPYSQGTNFVFNMGLFTNNSQIVYQSILATNNVYFRGVSNGAAWRLISINVLASGTRVIAFPTNIANAINTNGLTIVNTNYTINLQGGNEFRATIQSNAVSTSLLWSTFGQ